MDATSCKQHPYQINPLKLQVIQKEIDYMLENGIIEHSNSDWSSPCVLYGISESSMQLQCTKTDLYPIPRIDNCIDRVGHSSKLKGYWQVPLTEKAKQVSAFVTSNGLYQYRVIPIGMKNAPAKG